MSATTDQMNTAVANIESALVALGSAYSSYVAGNRTAKQDWAASRGLARAEDIDNAVGSPQLNACIAARMCALGLAPLLTQGLSAGTQASTWVAAWQAKITATVP